MAANNKSTTPQTRVVPNWSHDHRRPSSSMAGRPSHFFKTIVPSNINDQKLRIPESFVRQFEDELSAVATLTVPYGHSWQVGLEKAKKKIWFHHGWQDFVEYHSIRCGYFLIFRYDGNSKFRVLVLDDSATEIQYPRSKSCKFEDQVDVMESDDAKRSRQDHKSKSEEHEENMLVGKRGRERAIQAARLMLKPTSPSFMAILRPYHIRQRTLYVPVEFSIKYLSGHDEFVELQTCDGRQWRARCGDHRGNSAKNIGWAQFLGDNNLKEGDVCVFELLKRKPVVLNVSIFHAADYVNGV
ncbi:B3 domain-containing transcription factor VRN1-like [Alnus glutinosa]|uniref:B3 domain-containing transcription factor VRN1-like n=1 Tax=Alnus glutinosa TaxID=3517 RepID=UPI002D79A7DA|nr:B3 domain-containing transcription factor VRN1-like [Alnus glutinosa]